MFKPKDIGDKTASASTPLLKFEEKNNSGHPFAVAAFISLAIVVTCYVASILFRNPVLAAVAFVLAVLAVVMLVVIYRKGKSNRRLLSEKEIDKSVERYKQDLVDTYIGYDLEYSVEDVLDEADRYRERIEIESASIFDIDPASVAGMMHGFEKKEKAGDEAEVPAESGNEDD